MLGRAWGDKEALARAALATGIALALIPCALFALSSLYLLVGGRLGAFSAWAIIALTLAAVFWIARRESRAWTAPFAVLAVIAVALLAEHTILDTTYDGQEYHYDATRALADGWNPLREAFQPPANVRGHVPVLLWPQHYPQAAWLAAAVPIAAGIDIESAKLAPLMLAASLFFAAFGAALTWRLTRLEALALAALAAANPILIVQAFTRLNDGLLAASMALTALFAALWLRDGKRAYAGLAAGVLIFGLNLKFSALALMALLCAAIVISAWLFAGRTKALRALTLLAAAGVAGVFVFGAHPYVSNTFAHHHPFYPVMGEGAVDILTYNRPDGFNDISAPERLARSYFGPTSTSYDGGSGYKLPFTFQRLEIRAAGDGDTRLAGFGPLFSGAIILALALGAWIAARHRNRTSTIALSALLAITVLTLCLPEAWWARYVPHMWWIVGGVALIAMLSAAQAVRRSGWALAIILLLNAGFVAASSALQVVPRTLDARRQISEIAALNEPVCTYLGATHARLELLRAAHVDVRLYSEPLPQSCNPTLFVSAFRVADPRPNYCACPGR